MKPLEAKINRATGEPIDITPYNPAWPQMFQREKHHLLRCLPTELIKRIEHFGSTSIPHLAAKPIIDILAGVTSLAETRKRIVPILEAQGYDYFWRPSWGNDTPPFYAWFIKRDSCGKRTYHIHMVEPDFEHWDRLLFRDYLIEHRDLAKEYEELKFRLCRAFLEDRVAYTTGKGDFILRVTREAKTYYRAAKQDAPAEGNPSPVSPS